MMKKVFILTAFVMLTASMAMGDLAGYWNFNEGTGTAAADSSGNAKNGVLQKQGAGALPLWVTGHDGTGYALQFNAAATAFTNSNRVFVDITTNDKLATIGKTPAQAFTISMWVKSLGLTAEAGWWRYIVYTNGYDIAFASDPNSTAVEGYDFFDADANLAVWSLPLGRERDIQRNQGEWIHFVMTYDGNYLRKYVNGNIHYMTYPNPLRCGLSTATSDLFIGCGQSGGYFKGIIDDVAIWKGCYLPREQVLELYNGTKTPLNVTTHLVEGLLPVKHWVPT
jgi:hypothetical protein